MDQCVSVYCGGCRRKIGEGNGSVFEIRCPNCKSTTRLNVGARLPKIASKVAQIAQSQSQLSESTDAH